ncbi:protein phosphatase 1 regulatory subunit 32 [Paragonimus westermani]|uniref:Protein phosphatase 1 regulatory subunit 32 n=1 Tax=Paragonimus westermani TaxID=34504 RepID=A0A5J4NNS5_9TREM|nr:protein phosphatase 1 regulatory subunit 32 [Paragonimus westermani]
MKLMSLLCLQVCTQPDHLSEETVEKLKKTDPAEYQNVIHGFKGPSMHKGMFTNQQVQPTTRVSRLGQRSVGPNESSGFTRNEPGHVDYDAGPADQFVTHYMTRFYSPPPGKDGSDRCGHVHFNTQPCKQTSLATEVQVRRIEPQVPATDKLISLPPFQARSILARDQLGIQPPKQHK